MIPEWSQLWVTLHSEKWGAESGIRLSGKMDCSQIWKNACRLLADLWAGKSLWKNEICKINKERGRRREAGMNVDMTLRNGINARLEISFSQVTMNIKCSVCMGVCVCAWVCMCLYDVTFLHGDMLHTLELHSVLIWHLRATSNNKSLFI